MTRAPRPDFLIIGAPKAGTTALHAALAQHPEVFMSDPRSRSTGSATTRRPRLARPGRRALPAGVDLAARRLRAAVRAGASPHQVRGESTPFYLWSRGAHRRIAEHLPDVKLIAVVRDPIDRAYSNWMHLWSDGLEPSRRLREARSPSRTSGSTPAGRRSGGTATSACTASSSSTSTGTSTRSGCWSCATATSSTIRARRSTAPAGSSASRQGLIGSIPRDNSRTSSSPAGGRGCSGRSSAPAPGSASSRRREVWRKASAPLVAQLSDAGEAHRPHLSAGAAAAAAARVRRGHRAAQPAHRRGLRRLAVDRTAAARS